METISHTLSYISLFIITGYFAICPTSNFIPGANTSINIRDDFELNIPIKYISFFSSAYTHGPDAFGI